MSPPAPLPLQQQVLAKGDSEKAALASATAAVERVQQRLASAGRLQLRGREALPDALQLVQPLTRMQEKAPPAPALDRRALISWMRALGRPEAARCAGVGVFSLFNSAVLMAVYCRWLAEARPDLWEALTPEQRILVEAEAGRLEDREASARAGQRAARATAEETAAYVARNGKLPVGYVVHAPFVRLLLMAAAGDEVAAAAVAAAAKRLEERMPAGATRLAGLRARLGDTAVGNWVQRTETALATRAAAAAAAGAAASGSSDAAGDAGYEEALRRELYVIANDAAANPSVLQADDFVMVDSCWKSVAGERGGLHAQAARAAAGLPQGHALKDLQTWEEAEFCAEDREAWQAARGAGRGRGCARCLLGIYCQLQHA